MSGEVKTGFLDKEMTRRHFLKISGKSLVGFALSSALLQLFDCTQVSADNGSVSVWAMPEGLLVVNADKCTGCQRCEINCTLVNDGECSSYISRVKLSRNLFVNKNDVGMFASNWVYFPDTCRQCQTPPCGEACPVKAIYSDNKGVKIVDESKCVGCGACTAACPWKLPTINPETKKSSKCIACGACADGCPSGALSIIPWDAVTAAAQKTFAG